MKGIDFFRLNEMGLRKKKEAEREEEKKIYDTLLNHVNEGDEIVLYYTIGPKAEKEVYRLEFDVFAAKEIRKALQYSGNELEIYIPSKEITILLKRDERSSIYAEVKSGREG